MYSVIFLAFASFVLSLFLTPLVRNLALRVGLVDRPDDQRKTHKTPVPRVGGIAVIAATALEHGLTLVTRNVKDFAGLGVVLLNPWPPIFNRA